MDNRAARRKAEKAARALVSGKVELVGNLAVASAARNTATNGVKVAQEEGKALVEQAKKQSIELVNTARRKVEEADTAYSEVFVAAVSGGWTPKELADLGYEPAPRPVRKRPTVEKPAIDPVTLTHDHNQAVDSPPSSTAVTEHTVVEAQPA